MTREEFQASCRVRRLKVGESVNAFDCGDEDLNDFILNEAMLYREALLSVTYVVEDIASGDALAYFSLSNDKISISDFENKTDYNRFRKHKFVNEKRLRSYPAILLLACSCRTNNYAAFTLKNISNFTLLHIWLYSPNT